MNRENPLEQRLKEYSDPMRGPHGSASWKPNLDFWSERATENSQIAPRAKGPYTVARPEHGARTRRRCRRPR